MNNIIKVEKIKNVLSIYFQVETGWKQRLALFSDVHADSIYCDLKLYKKHLDQMVNDDAIGLWDGDLFDAMQGPRDPRASVRELKNMFKSGAYFDDIVNDSVEFHRPYAKNMKLVGKGNHDISAMKHYGTDLVERFASNLNLLEKSNVFTGGYAGWIRIMLLGKNNIPRGSIAIRYYHGGGAEAPVTKGTIEAERQAAWVDADVIWNGHTHGGYIMPNKRERLSNKGVMVHDLFWTVRTPGYKQPEQDPEGINWDISSGKRAKPRGCIWLDVEWHSSYGIEVTPVFAVK